MFVRSVQTVLTTTQEKFVFSAVPSSIRGIHCIVTYDLVAGKFISGLSKIVGYIEFNVPGAIANSGGLVGQTVLVDTGAHQDAATFVFPGIDVPLGFRSMNFLLYLNDWIVGAASDYAFLVEDEHAKRI